MKRLLTYIRQKTAECGVIAYLLTGTIGKITLECVTCISAVETKFLRKVVECSIAS